VILKILYNLQVLLAEDNEGDVFFRNFSSRSQSGYLDQNLSLCFQADSRECDVKIVIFSSLTVAIWVSFLTIFRFAQSVDLPMDHIFICLVRFGDKS
jgi:hypothetical protein